MSSRLGIEGTCEGGLIGVLVITLIGTSNDMHLDLSTDIPLMGYNRDIIERTTERCHIQLTYHRLFGIHGYMQSEEQQPTWPFDRQLKHRVYTHRHSKQ